MTPFQYLAKTKKQRMKDLVEFLQYPSVSAKSEHKKDVAACARWLAKHLKSCGFKSKIYPTKGHPVVYGEYMVDKKAPTVLYYGHYDVQPPEPLNLWKTDPFKATVRAGYLYARGSSDDKGQVFAQLKGLEAVLKTTGTLPINVKLLIEGEEEAASENLPVFIQKNKKLLKADIAVVSDTAQFSKTQPSVTFGLRGLAFVELFVTGPDRDVHSGTFGGAIANPANILCQMIGKLHDKDGKITIPGFYKKVKRLTKWEREQYRKLPFSEKAYKQALKLAGLHGEKGYSTFERQSARPTLDVNGITSGYQGEGAKTIIPSVASAKITCRLVPNMDPDEICNLLAKHLKKIAPKSVHVKVKKHGGAHAALVPSDGPWLEAAGRAIEAGFGKAPLFTREGGSIPIVADFKKMLGIDTLLIGYGQNDDNIHSPNERFRLKDFENGCKTSAILPDELAGVKN